MKTFRLTRYLIQELLPGLVLGVVVFVLILLTFQALRLTEFVLVHGVDLQTIGKIAGFLTVSFLPAILPMSLLFSVILTFGRLSMDSEIVAFKSLGFNMWSLYLPTLLLALLVSFVSAKTTFELAPWGNRKFEILITQLGASKAGISLREGTFAEGFFDLVIYANQVDSKKGYLKEVFIYDERKPDSPLTIIAQEGLLVQTKDPTTQRAYLRLKNGNIHRQTDTYLKINFETYDIHLNAPIKTGYGEKSAQSLTLSEIDAFLEKENSNHPDYLLIHTEYHKRWALTVAALLFAFVGVGLGTQANRRAVKSGGLALAMGMIVLYWLLYVVGDHFARTQSLSPALSVWLGNLFFFLMGVWFFRRSWI